MADQELRMNLAAVKRVDPYAKEIVDTSAHVAFYTFNSETDDWEKTDVEGAFFIYSRNAEPWHSIFINNRLNTNSLVEPITTEIEIQSVPPFLLYRNERTRIRGFWFYNSAECDRIADLVERLIADCRDVSNCSSANAAVLMASKHQQKHSTLSSSVASQATIASNGTMLPTLNNININSNTSNSNNFTNNITGSSVSKSSSSKPILTAAGGGIGIGSGSGGGFLPLGSSLPSRSGVNIFTLLSRAQEDFNNSVTTPKTGGGSAHSHHHQQQQQQQSSNTAVPPSPLQTQLSQPPPATPPDVTSSVMNFFAAAKPSTTEVPLFKRLISTNPLHTVEQIEKQQRASSPPNESDTVSVAGKSPPPIDNGGGSGSGGDGGFMRIHSPCVTTQSSAELASSPLATFLNASMTLRKPIDATATSTPAKPALMPPTMFQATSATKKTTAAAVAAAGGTIGDLPLLVTSKIGSCSTQQQEATDIKGEPLTQNQLLQAMNYLMKNDPEFLRKLHEAYLKSFAEKMVSV